MAKFYGLPFDKSLMRKHCSKPAGTDVPKVSDDLCRKIFLLNFHDALGRESCFFAMINGRTAVFTRHNFPEHLLRTTSAFG